MFTLFGSYRRIFAVPGALAFTLSLLISRLAFAMGGVSTVVLIADRRGSYALAGAVAAAGTIGVATTMPLLGRLVDRYGQTRVAVPGALFGCLPGVGALLCVDYGAPDWTLPALSAVASTVPNLGGMARARWAHLLRDDEAARHRANAFEQAVDELCYLAGPVLGMLLCTLLFPEAGLLAALVLGTVGVLLFATQRSTEPPLQPSVPGAPGALRSPGLRVMALAFAATGMVFGSMEVTTIAYLDSLGRRPLGGLLLGLVAAGSCLSGLAFGLVRPHRPAATRLLVGVAAMAGLLLLPLGAGLSGAGPVLLALAMFTAGSGTAPTMVSGMTLVQQLLPERQLNEGMAIAVSGILVGISAGSALGGSIAQHAAPGTGYLVPAGAALLALAVIAAGFRTLRRPAAAVESRTGVADCQVVG